MTNIVLSADSNGVFFLIISLVMDVLVLIMIAKFFEIAKDIKTMLFFVQKISKNTETNNKNVSVASIPTSEELRRGIIGTWKHMDITLVFSENGEYEKKQRYNFAGTDVFDTAKGKWQIDSNMILLSPIESTNKNDMKEESYIIMDLSLSSMRFKNRENNSQICLNRC